MEQCLPFPQQLRYERERRGWSQAVLAEKIGSDFKTVHRWESGKSFPHPYHRQLLCELFQKSAEELGLIERREDEEIVIRPMQKEDWGDAPLGGTFYGRDKELLQLEQWIDDHHCRVVALLGIGGIGKTALAAKVAEQVKRSFEYVFWRSVHNTPPVTSILRQCIQCISGQQCIALPESFDEQLLLLIQYLREHRCLLVLDNVESLMQSGRHDGHYQSGYQDYGKLIQCVGEVPHQSCLLLTSREKPKEVALLEGTMLPVRALHLAGVGYSVGQAILKDKNLLGSEKQWVALVDLYTGNPLALKLVSDTIRELFGGNIACFLQEEAFAFGYIGDLIGQQFHRLSVQERDILYWLAIEREAVSLETMYGNLVQFALKGDVFAAVDSLRRRFLIEVREPGLFTLQPVIMEYVTNDLVRRACDEFFLDESIPWTHYTFLKAQSKDYLRESQERLIVAPIAQRLLATVGREKLELKLQSLLTTQRQKGSLQRNYCASNVLKLLLHLGCDLRGVDFSSLVIWQAYLQDVALRHINFSHTHFISSVFKSTFGNVLSVAFSPLDQLFAMGTATGDVWIYHAGSGVALTNYAEHTDGVWSVAFHPDGRMLASASDDQTVRVWDMRTGRCLLILREHTNRVRSVAFRPDGCMLASASDDQTVRVWDVNTGRCLLLLQGHTDRVWSVAFSPDGTILATGSTDGSIRVWDVQSGCCLKILDGHADWVRTVAFSPKGDILASGSDDQTVRIWDTMSGTCLKVLHQHINRVWSVAFHPDGNILASSSEDRSIRLWETRDGTCLGALQGHTQGVRSLAMSGDGQILISGGDDQTVRVWELSTGSCLKTVQGYTYRIWSVAFHPDGQTLVSSAEDQRIQVWNSTTATCEKTFRSQTHGAKVASFSPDGTIVASGGEDQMIRLWEVSTGRCLHVLAGHTNWIRAVAFSPDGKILASGSEDHTIRLWNSATSHCLTLLEGHTSWIRSVMFSPDGSILASGGDDGTILLWHVATAHCFSVLQDHTGRVRTVAFSPDGKLLASGGEDQTIRLWDVTTGHCLSTLRGQSSWVRSVTFSPDGKLLASSGEDQIIRLWDIMTCHCIKVLWGHANRIRSLAFDPSGQTLASGSDDGTIKLWNMQTGACFSTLLNERPYEGMNITGASGLTEAQKEALRSLGAIDENI
jgi:WD40 repeat protein/transcriptional regulator with XRE-family HTH domain